MDQLKLEKINKDAPIWFDELGEWVTAKELEELEDFLQEKNTDNVFSSFPHSNNFNQPIEFINNFSVAINFNKAQYLNSISLLLFGIAVVASIIVLFNS